MDYEKKYNEALKWMRELYPGLHGATKEDAEHYFPELRESEDERIRKILIEVVNITPASIAVRNKRELLDWLEKQKEQPISAEEVLARAGLKPYKDGNQWCILAGDNIQEGICGFGDTIDEALYQFLMEVLEKQKEQKLVWSEEDERMLSRCIKSVESSKNFAETQTFKEAKDKEKDWLKSLPERLNLQPKQEWSEEDEMKLGAIITDIETRSDLTEPVKIKYVSFLKSLRPSWKPSEEQMGALLWCVAHLGGADRRVLAELYEQLKKL